MRLAVAVWEGRVSPVFDSAGAVAVVTVEGSRETGRTAVELRGAGPKERADILGREGVDTLICGAVSQPVAEALAAVGIRVVPFVAGDADAVLAAFLRGETLLPRFAMPGCGVRRAARAVETEKSTPGVLHTWISR
jgi:predicted Fe-Mo cluster-binding NifX family protein